MQGPVMLVNTCKYWLRRLRGSPRKCVGLLLTTQLQAFYKVLQCFLINLMEWNHDGNYSVRISLRITLSSTINYFVLGINEPS